MPTSSAIGRVRLIIAMLVIGGLALGLSGFAPQTSRPATPPPPAPSQAAATKPAASQPVASAPAVAPLVYVQITTNKGNMVLELNHEKAPLSVENFLRYADKKFYDNTIFHRVMPGFMVQAGGYGIDKALKPADPAIKNEWRNGLKNTRGTIAMARFGRQPDSASDQFFINVVDNAMLDQPNDGAGYAVFGRVVAGMSVADAISTVPTHSEGMQANWPNDPVIMQKVERITAEQATKAMDAEPKQPPATKPG